MIAALTLCVCRSLFAVADLLYVSGRSATPIGYHLRGYQPVQNKLARLKVCVGVRSGVRVLASVRLPPACLPHALKSSCTPLPPASTPQVGSTRFCVSDPAKRLRRPTGGHEVPPGTSVRLLRGLARRGYPGELWDVRLRERRIDLRARLQL